MTLNFLIINNYKSSERILATIRSRYVLIINILTGFMLNSFIISHLKADIIKFKNENMCFEYNLDKMPVEWIHLIFICRQINSLHGEVIAQRALDRKLTSELLQFKQSMKALTKELRHAWFHFPWFNKMIELLNNHSNETIVLFWLKFSSPSYNWSN